MADYNINAVTRRVVLSGSAGTGPYAFTFEVLDQDDIAVYFDSTKLTLTTDYTVTVDAAGTGSVTIVTGNNVPSTPTSSNTITIIGARDIARVTDFVTAGEFRASAINEQLDALTIFDQQVAEENKRALMAPAYDPAHVDDSGTLDMTLPTKDDRKGKYLAFNATTGNPEAGPSTDDVNTLSAITDDIATLADIEDGTVATDAISNLAAITSDVTTAASNITAIQNASTNATTASTKATEAAASATTASTKATEAATSATTATTKASEAATSATSAATSATTATTKASEASTSATNAATSATSASTAQTAAETAKTAAETAKTAAETAKTGAETAKTAAETAKTGAETAKTAAETAQTAAETAETNAATSETNAATSASTATTKATEAATSATNAATSETNAATSATNAATSATAAAASQTAAAASASAAAASFDSFDDRYLGVKASDPTTDNDGDPLAEGMLYFSSTDNEMKVYDGANWIAASSAGSASLLNYNYTATGGQTTFSGADDNSATLSYTASNIIVTLNGVVLEDGTDYTATNGTSVVLTDAASADDELNIVAFKSFTTADMVSATTGGTFNGNVTIDANATITGDLTVDTSTLYVDSTNNRVGVGELSPTANLHVLGEAEAGNGAGLRLQVNNNNSFDDLGTISFANNVEDDCATIKGITTGSNTNGSITFSVNNSGMQEVMRLANNGNVGIGTSSAAALIHGMSGDLFLTANSTAANSGQGVYFQSTTSGWATSGAHAAIFGKRVDGSNGYLRFDTRSGGTTAERMRIDSSGNVLVATTSTAVATQNSDLGINLDNTGRIYTTGSGHHDFNRTSDGEIIRFRSAANTEGNISISGSTVSYNGFTGTHWTRFSDNSKPTTLRGTVLESIGTMMDWYQAEFDITTQDDDGNDVVTTHKVSCAKPANKNVGDTFDFVLAADNDENLPAGTYSATLLQEADIKHVKAKVSDTSESKAVYGVFSHWDSADGVNDMYVASVGTSVVRILSTETVAIGDLLDSNGDGTAKVQSDDIIRSRTIGKVLSTVKQETYSDGSYTVPCALYCG